MVSPDFRDSDPLARFRACIEVQVEVARRRCRDSVSRLVGPNIDLFDIYAVFLDIDYFRPVECGCMGGSESSQHRGGQRCHFQRVGHLRSPKSILRRSPRDAGMTSLFC